MLRHNLQQMKSKFVAKYDFDGKKSMELRQQWWQQGKKKVGLFYFTMIYKSHFLRHGIISNKKRPALKRAGRC